VGKCIADNTGSGGVMCPSYVVSREEKDSTRGRARVLQDVVTGLLDFDDPAVDDALDLCLSCKGCARDCPTGIDMATYKSEALHQRYRRRLRPRSHYALGRLPRWLRASRPLSRVAGPLLGVGPLERLAKAAAGVDERRGIPLPARRSLRSWARRTSYERRAADLRSYDVPDVVVWADTFTDHFTPGNAHAAVQLLERAGLTVGVVGEVACCALTWVSTGQLDAARRILGRTVETLHAYAAADVPVLALEPSCLATLRSDAAELLDDPRVAAVARNTRTLAELLTDLPGWTPPDLTGVEVVVQPHCHHASILGWEADARLLSRTGATVTRVDGCCGLAGNFGVERGHYEVSVAVAETHLLPAVRKAGPEAVLVADGFSCRTQLEDLAGVRSVHLAELLNRPAGLVTKP
jgi:Fe-S oxidoreductase